MRRSILLILFSINIAAAFGQGTFQFYANLNGANELPPNFAGSTGDGSFSLTGTHFAFTVSMQPSTTPISAGIYGPAVAGQSGSLLFDLGASFIVAPGSGNPGSVNYNGDCFLSGQQAFDLENGLWYVNILTPQFPEGELRGAIMPVPEPSTFALLALFTIVAVVSRQRMYPRDLKFFGLILVLVVGFCSNDFAQGTVQFEVVLSGANEIPANPSLGDGEAQFTLTGSSFTFLFGGVVTFQDFATPIDITINGPANSSSSAPVLFDLGAPKVFLIQPPPGRGYGLQGVVDNLTSPQINDLLAGKWYANIFTDSGNFPGGEIRGQITPVPEPSITFLFMGAVFFPVAKRSPRHWLVHK